MCLTARAVPQGETEKAPPGHACSDRWRSTSSLESSPGARGKRRVSLAQSADTNTRPLLLYSNHLHRKPGIQSAEPAQDILAMVLTPKIRILITVGCGSKIGTHNGTLVWRVIKFRPTRWLHQLGASESMPRLAPLGLLLFKSCLKCSDGSDREEFVQSTPSSFANLEPV